MIHPLFSLGIGSEQDVVTVRQRAREVSAMLEFSGQDQVRVATAVSELARTIFAYASGGQVEFEIGRAGPLPALNIRIKSSGGGIRTATADTAAARNMPWQQDEALDAALVSAQRLMDGCDIREENGRMLEIALHKYVPASVALTPERIAEIVRLETRRPVTNTYQEVQLQNRELLDTLAELRVKQDDLLSLTQELEDTNRGVLALYAEIEEKAERLREADAMKSRFLSNTSHELRTPLSSIRALSQILLDRIDGELTGEQEKQIQFINQAATNLSDLVNDLLDLAKIEAGKTEINSSSFTIGNLFSTLRGMLRPLSEKATVELFFEEPGSLEMITDEGKLSQILRNFISNALKFTEHGSVRVSARADAGLQTIRFSVADTGIGIAPENLQFVFEEFSQIESPLQRRVKGTGLGLPLCRKLAASLGGHVELASEPGKGSVFSAVLPLAYRPAPNDGARRAESLITASSVKGAS
jgi:signal transduction histidine kinase